MQVSLEGPDDLGYWYLSDDEGNSFEFINRHEDHLNATMLGWKRPVGIEDEEAITNALEWLMENTGEEFEAPAHVTEYFEELYRD